MSKPQTQANEAPSQSKINALGSRLKSTKALMTWAFLASIFACLSIWGSGFDMEFPFNWSRPVGSSINDAVRWMTREGAWLFDRMAYAIIMLIVWIKRGLTWIP